MYRYSNLVCYGNIQIKNAPHEYRDLQSLIQYSLVIHIMEVITFKASVPVYCLLMASPWLAHNSWNCWRAAPDRHCCSGSYTIILCNWTIHRYNTVTSINLGVSYHSNKHFLAYCGLDDIGAIKAVHAVDTKHSLLMT